MTGSQTYWQALADAADRGDLYLDPDAARACDSACTTYLQQLRDRQVEARDLAEVGGWGDFESGQQFRQILADKAVGGANNMVDALQSHIEVVLEMQAVFAKFFTSTTDTDYTTASEIGSNGPR